jgi:hypothetical protein
VAFVASVYRHSHSVKFCANFLIEFFSESDKLCKKWGKISLTFLSVAFTTAKPVKRTTGNGN